MNQSLTNLNNLRINLLQVLDNHPLSPEQKEVLSLIINKVIDTEVKYAAADHIQNILEKVLKRYAKRQNARNAKRKSS